MFGHALLHLIEVVTNRLPSRHWNRHILGANQSKRREQRIEFLGIVDNEDMHLIRPQVRPANEPMLCDRHRTVNASRRDGSERIGAASAARADML